MTTFVIQVHLEDKEGKTKVGNDRTVFMPPQREFLTYLGFLLFTYSVPALHK